jgi:hypothetical protein
MGGTGTTFTMSVPWRSPQSQEEGQGETSEARTINWAPQEEGQTSWQQEPEAWQGESCNEGRKEQPSKEAEI